MTDSARSSAAGARRLSTVVMERRRPIHGKRQVNGPCEFLGQAQRLLAPLHSLVRIAQYLQGQGCYAPTAQARVMPP
jgi:hypothetical protein